MRGPIILSLFCLLPACQGRAPAPQPARGPNPEAATQFDPSATGNIAGKVCWGGPLPDVEPFRSSTDPLSPKWPPPAARDWANPNAPRIDPSSHTLANAIVLLRGVDARKARPWDLPTARIEMRDQTFQVVQGSHADHIGFVRAGDSVDFVSRDVRLHVVQARGVAFFSLGLPRPDRVRSRRLDTPGVVEVQSGAGYFWMRAYLHVSDHPYLTRTGADGHFHLTQVPAGEYDLVVWHPNWRVETTERNPDLIRVQQVKFASPLEKVRRVRVQTGKITNVEFEMASIRQAAATDKGSE